MSLEGNAARERRCFLLQSNRHHSLLLFTFPLPFASGSKRISDMLAVSVESFHTGNSYLLQTFLHLLISLSCFAWHQFITGDSITIIINRCLLRRSWWRMWKTVNVPALNQPTFNRKLSKALQSVWLRASHLVVSVFFPSASVVIYCHDPHVPSGCPALPCCKEFPY